MAKQSPKQRKIVGRVMHEWKRGQLKTAGGRKVKNPKQAVAIGLSEAGASSRQSPRKNARNLSGAKRRERQGKTGGRRSERGAGGPTKSALYAQVKRRNIAGRSRVSKSQLARALGK